MSADRRPYILTVGSEELADADALLQELEEIIHETLPPDLVEEAYVAALKHLLKAIGGEAILATDRLLERVTQRPSDR